VRDRLKGDEGERLALVARKGVAISAARIMWHHHRGHSQAMSASELLSMALPRSRPGQSKREAFLPALSESLYMRRTANPQQQETETPSEKMSETLT